MEVFWSGRSRVLAAILVLTSFAFAITPVCAQTGAIGSNFFTMDNNTTGTINGFTLQPPDTTGTVGLNNYIAFNNGSFSIFSKTGSLVSRVTDNQFWNSAGIAGSLGLSDTRILYDPSCRRWFAVEITTNEPTNNRILIARSNSSDPTAGFSAVQLTTSNGQFADFPTLGVDANGLMVGTNNFNAAGTINTGTSVYSIPKTDIVTNSPPSLANLTQFTLAVPSGNNGTIPQPAYNFGAKLTTDSSPIVWGFNSTTRSFANLTNTNVQTPSGASLSARNLVGITGLTSPTSSGQGSGTITNGDTRHGSHAEQIGNFLYTATSTSVSGRTAVRWTIYNVSTSTPTVAAQGNLTDAALSYFYPSIAVNSSGDVVMGFSGSASGQFISTYAVVGSSSGPGGAITFGTPFQTKAGLGTTNNSRWGDYSTTSLDPTDPGIFWIHQEYAGSAGTTGNWATQASEIVPTKTGEKRWGVANSNAAAPSGSFTDSTKYLTGAVGGAPAPTDHVIFSRANSTYTVTGQGGQTSDRATVRQGNVTWDLGGGIYTLTNPGATTPSLGVSDFQGTSTLTLSNGTVSSVHATIGAGYGGTGTVNVGGAAPANWNHTGTIYVGGDSTGPKGGIGNLVVNSGSSINNPVGTVQVHPGGTLSGTGTIAGSVNVTGGATTIYHDGSTVGTNRLAVNSVTVGPAKIAPGNLTTTIGTLSTGPLSITNGGAYNWKVSAVGTPGVGLNTGGSDAGATKDLLAITGAMTLNNLEIDVVGVGSHGFNNAQSYSWTIGTFTPGLGAIVGTPTFVLTNITPAAGSQFSLGLGTGAVFLNYSPVPEPASILAACAVAGGAWSVWRRRRSSEPSLTA